MGACRPRFGVPLTLAIVVMGQHLPRLEFLRILLGNEPVLEPHEHLYHQFLAQEASLAAKEAEHWIGEHTFENYLDDVAIPTLRVAADDHKRGVLGREQFLELSETITEYLQLVRETLEYGREQQAATVAAKPGAVPRSTPSRTPWSSSRSAPYPQRSSSSCCVASGRLFRGLRSSSDTGTLRNSSNRTTSMAASATPNRLLRSSSM
jgi:hypothetical protein